jgi:hypothetical protein
MTVEVIEFMGFSDAIQKQLKTHKEEGKIRVKTFEVQGKTRPFIDGDDVINRLNEAFSHAWSDEVLSVDYADNEVMIRVKLSVMFPNGYTVSHEGYGSGTPRGRGSALRGDLYKSAHTSAIKAAAKRFGIGLFVEDSDFDDVRPSTPTKSYQAPKAAPPAPKPAPAPTREIPPVVESVSLTEDSFDPFSDVVSSLSGPPKGEVAKRTGLARPSDAQLNALHNMSRSLGVSTVEAQVELMRDALSQSDLSDDEKEVPANFGELSKRQASAVISFCVNQMDSKKRRA